MALNPKTAVARRNAMLDNFAGNANSGYLRIYSGTQPTDADTAIGAQVLLAELRMNATAFGSAATGVVTANAITSGTAAATGTAAWFRLLKSDGTTVLMDGSVGTSGCDATIATTSIVQNATVSCSTLTVSQGA